MNETEKSSKSSLRIYLILINVIFVITILVLNWRISPRLVTILKGISSTELETIKKRLFNITVGAFTFVFLISCYFWRSYKSLEREEEEAQKILNMNPENLTERKKLDQLDKKRQFYITILELFLITSVLITIGLILSTVFLPIYSILMQGL